MMKPLPGRTRSLEGKEIKQAKAAGGEGSAGGGEGATTSPLTCPLAVGWWFTCNFSSLLSVLAGHFLHPELQVFFQPDNLFPISARPREPWAEPAAAAAAEAHVNDA